MWTKMWAKPSTLKLATNPTTVEMAMIEAGEKRMLRIGRMMTATRIIVT